jgi:O-antigen ligase
LTSGYYFAAHSRVDPRPSTTHDTLAYIFCGALLLNYVSIKSKYLKHSFYALSWAFFLSLLLAVSLGIIGREWTTINALYGETRWQHLSINPNQFALVALPLPFLAFYFILFSQCRIKMIFAGLLGYMSLFLGWLSQSNALTLGWLLGGFLCALSLRDIWPAWKNYSNSRERVRYVIASFLVLLTVLGSAWQARTIAQQVEGAVSSGTGTVHQTCSGVTGTAQKYGWESHAQVCARFCLWINAIEKIKSAPLTGYGPGSHSGISSPNEAQEAHNTLLDWGTQTGVFGIAAMLAWMLWILWMVVQRKRYELAGMLIGLYIFSMFHIVARQPLFWIIPVFALALAEAPRRGVFPVAPGH